MNINKLVEQIEDFLSSKERKRKQKRKFLKEVIKKLKKHEAKLKEKLETETDDASRVRIEKEISLTRAQRKKGLNNLGALKKVPKDK